MADSINGLTELLAAFDGLPAQVKAAAVRGVTRGVMIVHRDSIRNAPRSPSQMQKDAGRKTKRDTSKQKKPRTTSRAKPSGLERSIMQAVDAGKCEGSIFVAANSEAGKYAKMIHDKKGVDWQNRGKGTVAKGARADEKFIERAVNEDAPKVSQVLETELKKVEL